MSRKKAVMQGNPGVAKRALTILGLAGSLIAWAALGVYGLICFLEEIGWIA